MQKAYLHYIKHALAAGYHIHVDDGGERIRCGDSYQAAKDAVEAVEAAHINVVSSERNPETGKFICYGWAYAIPFGLDPEETVADYSVTPYNEAWEAEYYKS
jgi:hypothetical protein